MTTQLERQLEQYDTYLKEERHLSDHTRDAYMRDMHAFLVYARAEGLQCASVVQALHISRYIVQLRTIGRAASTVTRHKATIRSFFLYMYREGLVATDPTLGVDTPKAERKSPHLLTIEQVEQLLSAPDPNTAQGIRDRAMLETLYGTGVRISELIALNCDDVHLNLAFLRSIMNQKERIIPLGQVAVEALHTYLNHVRPQFVSNSQPDELSDLDKVEAKEQALFVNTRGQRMTRQGFWKMVKKYASLLSWHFPFTPNSLRQSFAAHMLNNGADARAVQEMLGHADVSTTQRYAHYGARLSMKEVYTTSHPRARKSP
ncbi:tyrosine recombinase [Paenibacillus taiwanensis]|uniref:tyrosine recombinase n=1 Tax=Paenibacillus taiwanensis TaxID=401638 RepID=UPI000419AFD9|nr:tyrosine recombinase [Paenibacillus taiwanensis]